MERICGKITTAPLAPHAHISTIYAAATTHIRHNELIAWQKGLKQWQNTNNNNFVKFSVIVNQPNVKQVKIINKNAMRFPILVAMKRIQPGERQRMCHTFGGVFGCCFFAVRFDARSRSISYNQRLGGCIIAMAHVQML